jgi:hypothetical protein
MTTYKKDNHTVIKADEGNFLMRKDGNIYGVEISLGTVDRAEYYDELPISDWPQAEEEPIDNETE